jgi:hypothetical protein
VQRECWTQGLAVRLFLTKSKPVTFEVIPLQSSREFLKVDILPPAGRKAFEKHLHTLCTILQQPKKHQKLWDAWCVERGDAWIQRLTDLPKTFRSRDALMQWAALENMLRCEAHQEVMMNFLKLVRNREISKAKKA